MPDFHYALDTPVRYTPLNANAPVPTVYRVLSRRLEEHLRHGTTELYGIEPWAPSGYWAVDRPVTSVWPWQLAPGEAPETQQGGTDA